MKARVRKERITQKPVPEFEQQQPPEAVGWEKEIEQEMPLYGGNVTGTVRIGQTIRRNADCTRPFSNPYLLAACLTNPATTLVTTTCSTAGATLHDDAHGAFMTLPPYSRTREGEVHQLGGVVRTSSGRAFAL